MDPTLPVVRELLSQLEVGMGGGYALSPEARAGLEAELKGLRGRPELVEVIEGLAALAGYFEETGEEAVAAATLGLIEAAAGDLRALRLSQVGERAAEADVRRGLRRFTAEATPLAPRPNPSPRDFRVALLSQRGEPR